MNNKIMKFDLDQSQLKVKDLLNKEFLELKIKCISTADPNRNNSHFTKEALVNAIPTFYNKPILGSFSVQQDDFRAHEGDLAYDEELGQYYYDYTDEIAETPVGLIRGTDEVKVYTDKKDGLDWISVTAAIWVQYNYKQVKKLLKSKDGHKKISVEVQVNDSYVDDRGVEIIKDFTFTGLSILGDKYETGIADANMTILDMIDNAVFQKKQKALNFAYNNLDNSQAESLDFKDQGSNKKNSAGVENEDPEESISMKEKSKKGGKDDPMKKENEAKLNEEQKFESGEVCPDCGKDPCECESKAKCEKEEDKKEEESKETCEKKEGEDPEDKKEEESCGSKEEESCGSEEKCAKDPEDDKDKDDEDPDDDKDDDDEDDKEDMTCKFAVDDSVIQLATEVMASYQNANKWLDIIKEMLFTDLGCVFFSSYVHSLAHTMPGRFDKFGDILHTVNIKVPYPPTEYIPNEVTNVGEAFKNVFMILDSIKFNLNAFIKATDGNYHGMACAAESLLNEIEEEYVPLYKMQKAFDSCNGDLVKFDKWINEYVNNRDRLVESLNTFESKEEEPKKEEEAKGKKDPRDKDKGDDEPSGEEKKGKDKNPDDDKNDPDDSDDTKKKEKESKEEKFDAPVSVMDPNSEPTDASRDVDDKDMDQIVEATTAAIKAPPVQLEIIGEGSTVTAEPGEGPNGEKANPVSDNVGIEGNTTIEQPDDSAKEDVFSAQDNVSTVEVDGENIDINTLLEKYNKLNERFAELSENVKVREAQDLAKFGEEFINSDTDVDEEARKEFVEKVSSKCEKFELLTQEEVKEFAKSLLAMYYYENIVSKKNKDANFSIDIQGATHKESQASNNKLKDAINKLNHVQ